MSAEYDAPAAAKTAQADTGTLGKTIALLDLVAMADGPMRFTDILARCGQPRGTLHRQLSHLLSEALLELDAEGRYQPGMRLLTLAARSWARNDLRSIAAPHLRNLQARTGETVHLGVLRGAQVIYLDKVEGRQSVRMYSHIGNASPAYCTGVGKAALSVLDDGRLNERVEAMIFEPFTPQTHRDAAALLADISDIRVRGYAFDHEEHESGICCVAAPIFSLQRDIFAGVSVTGPAYRVSVEKLCDWSPDVVACAAEIMNDLVNRLGPEG
jgi:IclR family transcriptional regulator, acetate operon repressor